MPITASDLLFKLSTATGPGNSSASTPNASLGGFMSTTDFAAGSNTLFDDITGAENAASTVDYRCVFVFNSHGSLTLQNAVVYVSAEVAGGANVAIAVDNLGPSIATSSSAQAGTIANETTAPSGTSGFSTPTTAGAGLSLGNIGPGQCKAVWVKRSATNSAAVSGDGFTLAITGDTAA